MGGGGGGGGMEERERESVVMKREGIWGDSFGLSRIKGEDLKERDKRVGGREREGVFFKYFKKFFHI